MSVKSKKAVKTSKSNKSSASTKKNPAKQKASDKTDNREGYVLSMGYCNRIDEDVSGIQMIPAAIFVGIAILIVRLHRFFRDMSGFFWSDKDGGTPENPGLVDFFSYYKTTIILVCAILALVFVLYRVVTQSFAVKRSTYYIPIGVYVLFVLLSFAFSKTKEIAWIGWNERFEGTLMILCYMLMLLYIFNTINTEKNLKWIIYPLAGSSLLLSFIGISQAIDKDFFRSLIGQKLIVPNEQLADGTFVHDLIQQAADNGEPYLKFTFQNNEIYQTVYNINYVSFYLTLLIPLFSILFVREQNIGKKIFWGFVNFLVFFNLIGSASSGGLMGSGIALILTIVILNKRLIKWKWSVSMLFAIIISTGVVSYVVADQFGGIKWTDEFAGAFKSALNIQQNEETASDTPDEVPYNSSAAVRRIDSLVTEADKLKFIIDGESAEMQLLEDGSVIVSNSSGDMMASSTGPLSEILSLSDDSFSGVYFIPVAPVVEGDPQLVGLQIEGSAVVWPFGLDENNELKFINGLGKQVGLVDVPHFGFKNNPGFGSGRGYIWSASLPMIKDTIFIGHGADTYCVNFPHNDYLGKYNAGWDQENLSMIIDKPHNMYIGIAINTGVISLIALLALFGMYLVQSAKLYWKEEKYDSLASVSGIGIALGITGFLVSGIVNDSSVSVMPLFYGLLGTGFAANMIVKRNREKSIS